MRVYPRVEAATIAFNRNFCGFSAEFFAAFVKVVSAERIRLLRSRRLEKWLGDQTVSLAIVDVVFCVSCDSYGSVTDFSAVLLS